MLISFHINLDNTDIENRGDFCEAFEQIIKSMIPNGERPRIVVETSDLDNDCDPEEEADSNKIDITLEDIDENSSVVRFATIFRMCIDILRSYDGCDAYPYIP